ncbi:MAG: hypothetical protein K8R89_02480 [Anaerolineae bacterium]|nr:hypothetical protein [Anaerolineae bacterium]
MSKTMNNFLVKYKPILIAVVTLLIAVAIADPSAIQVTATSVRQQPVRFLSPPYYGTTTVSSIYDHEYPDYSTIGQVLHYDNTTTGSEARQNYDGHNGIDYLLRYELVRAAAPGDVIYAGWDVPTVHSG